MLDDEQIRIERPRMGERHAGPDPGAAGGCIDCRHDTPVALSGVQHQLA